MVTKIDGTTGVDRHQDGSVLQADLASGIAGNGPLLLAAGPVTNMSSGVSVKFSEMAPSVDLGSGWDATNLRYSPKVAGWYLVAAEARFFAATNLVYGAIQVFKNGAFAMSGGSSGYATYYASAQCVGLVYLNGSTDYLELLGELSGTGGTLTREVRRFHVVLLRAANV